MRRRLRGLAVSAPAPLPLALPVPQTAPPEPEAMFPIALPAIQLRHPPPAPRVHLHVVLPNGRRDGLVGPVAPVARGRGRVRATRGAVA